VLVNGGQRPQLANGQLPQKAARHGLPLHKENFAWIKDNKISLIRQSALF
jgi:hypothetical protein